MGEEVVGMIMERMAEGAGLEEVRSVVSQVLREGERAAEEGFRHGRP